MKRKYKNYRRGAAGFTLIELLLVLVILAILASVVVVKFTGRQEQAQTTKVKVDIKSIETALESFKLDAQRLPTSEEGLQSLIDAPAGLTDMHAPYLSLPPDPWKHPYMYKNPGTHNSRGYDIYSIGPDGQDGTADDIGNWDDSTK